jgi:alpha-D-ribose 1-methylphosphonate 5-triphosphate synthase subunit PhnI
MSMYGEVRIQDKVFNYEWQCPLFLICAQTTLVTRNLTCPTVAPTPITSRKVHEQFKTIPLNQKFNVTYRFTHTSLGAPCINNNFRN